MEMTFFYLSFIVNENDMIDLYVQLFGQMNESYLQQQISVLNKKYFSPELRDKLMRGIAEVNVYYEHNRKQFLETDDYAKIKANISLREDV